MLTGSLAFLAGVLLLQQQAHLPPLSLCLTASLLLFPLWRFPLFRLFGYCLLGLLWALLRAHWVLVGGLPPELESVDLLVEGRIAGLPLERGERVSFDLEVGRLWREGIERTPPGRIRLSWYDRVSGLKPGDRWRLLVRLKRPHGFMNPGGFDYEGWLLRDAIRAKGYVRASGENRLLGRDAAMFSPNRLRFAIGQLIERGLDEPASAAQLKALVIGDRSGLSADDWELFRHTGTNHLVAISGLHIGIVAGLGLVLGERFWRLSARLTLLLPAPVAAALVAFLLAFGYAALAGFSVPTQRALIMLSVLLGGLVFRRRVTPAVSFGAALLAVLIHDPLAVLSAGFWLSFLAVGVILLGAGGRWRPAGWVHAWVATQWSIALGLAPALLLAGLEVPLLAPIVNLLAVPFYSLLVIPLALGGTFCALLWEPGGLVVLQFTCWLLDLCREWLQLMAVPGSEFTPTGPLPLWVWLSCCLGVLWVLLPAGVPGRWLAGVLLLPLFALEHQQRPAEGAFWFDLLDVGQGLAAVVQTQRHLLMFDAGPAYGPGFDAGSAVLVPFLRQRGLARIDRLVLTNGDADHRGGLPGLAERFPIGRIMSGEPARIDKAGVVACKAGEKWIWDGVLFEVIHPSADRVWRGNNASCVLRVGNAAGRLLLSGDIERAAERSLLQLVPDGLAVDVALVPHHGSRTSSSVGFVERVAPDYALVASGYRNRYLFPRAEVVARWRAVGARVLNTAETGAIHFRFSADGVRAEPRLHRHGAGRYWHR